MKNLLKTVLLLTGLTLIFTSCQAGKPAQSSAGSSAGSFISDFISSDEKDSGNGSDGMDSSVSEFVNESTGFTSSSALFSSVFSSGAATPNSSQTVSVPYNPAWAGETVKVQDLGKMQLTAYPDDINYDWAFSVMKMGDTYKMWWTRQSPYDTVWYAESKDLKNWTNAQRVLRIDTDSTWIKMHIARPTVVYVNKKYYMYLEAPATLEENYGEYDNNVFLATSTDGIHFSLYPNNTNPVPIIKEPDGTMKQRKYGVGQPTAFYKDGKFYLYYTDAINGDGMKIATSTDGVHFGNYEDHKRVFDRAAVGVKYNSLTKKFMMVYSVDPSLWNSTLKRNEQVYYMESSDGINWPYKTIAEGSKNPAVVSSSASKIRGYADFVTNPQGVVDTPTIYVTYMEGELAPIGSDWKAKFTTWDGHIVAVNPKAYSKKSIVLPNQTDATTANLALYKDNTTKLTRQVSSAKYTTSAPKIDGTRDTVWDNTKELKIQRQVPAWGMTPGSTAGTARVLWDSQNLYAYIKVSDSKISYSYKGSLSDMWHRDSVDLFIDVPNDHTVIHSSWTPMQYRLSVCADGNLVVKGAKEVDITEEFTGIQKSVTKVSDGYVIEVKLPWYSLVKNKIAAGKTIGFDMQINDDRGAGDRQNIIAWNDRTANSFQWTDVMGDLKLIQ